MLHNDKSVNYDQKEESYRLAVKTVATSVLFAILALIVISTGIMGVKSNQLLLVVLIFSVFTCCMLTAVWVFKLTNPWIKYAIIVVLSLGISSVNIFCRMNKLNVTWLYAVVIASLFLSTKANWFSMAFQLLALAISDYIAVTYFPQNFGGTTPWFVLAMSNGIQFIIMSLACIAINYKISGLLKKMKKGEADKNKTLQRLGDVLKASSNVSDTLNKSVSQISKAATKSEQLNNKIAIDVENLLANFESTLVDMDYALKATEIIMEKHSSISQKGQTIADIFSQEDTMNDSVQVIIDNAVKLMQNIENSTEEGMELVDLIHQNSLAVMNTLVLINGTVEKIKSLSLNAYIEASRAGEFQNGFEVVAYDIKKLGERAEKESQMIFSLTKDTTSEIEFACRSVKEDIECIKAGQEIVQKVEQLFEKASIENKNVNKHIQDVNDNIKFIADSDKNINELVKSIKELNVESIEELRGISEITVQQIESFNEFIDVLKGMEKIGEDLSCFLESPKGC